MDDQHSKTTFSPDLIEKAKWLITSAHSFNSANVITKIVKQEQQRMNEENSSWQIAGGLAMLAIGLSDGFNFTDLLFGLGGATVAGKAHALFSEDQKKFLNEIDAYWIVEDGSPLDIAKRVGMAKSRVLAFTPGEAKPFAMYNHHRGNRGDFLVRLSTASQKCFGFTHAKSLETLTRNFPAQKIQAMSKELYPTMKGTIKIDSIRLVDQEDALKLDPNASAIIDSNIRPVVIEKSGTQSLYYRADIPIHSDY